METGFSSRIYGLLEAELRKQLAFAFVIDRNHSRPGAANLSRGDRIRFKVYALNNSGVLLRDVEGSIAPDYAAEFFSKPFHLDELKARHKAHIATIEAEIVSRGVKSLAIDQLGKVSVTAKADLSDFRLREIGRPLVHAKAPSRQAAEPMTIIRSTQPPERPARNAVAPRRSVPVSTVH